MGDLSPTTSGAPRPAARRSHGKDRYQLLEEVGTGGMGTVYRALDRELNRTIAVKMLRPEVIPDLRNLLRLKRELLLASRVHDEHVVAVHDIGALEGRALITMDWVEGESLAQLLNRVVKLPPSQVIHFARQIGQALRAIHSAYIVHRDLKPGNLLIRNDGAILVSDFGMARSILPEDVTLSKPGDVNGTPCYMAPEQLAGLPADARSDFYSLGVVLLKMLTGMPILEALRPLRTRIVNEHSDLRRRAAELRDLEVLEGVIDRCLRPDRTERYGNADELLEDLRLAPAALSVEPNGKSRARRLRGSRARRLGLAGAVLALMAAGYAVLEQRRRAEQAVVSAQLYAKALALITPQSGEAELRSALDSLDRALAEVPENVPAIRARLEALIGLYERTTGRKWLEKARTAAASQSANRLSRRERTLFQARIDLHSGAYENAIHSLRNESWLMATSEEANRLLGRALEASNQTEEALECYRAAIRLSPESWLAHNELGYAQRSLGRLQQARKEFVRVTELRPDSPTGYLSLGAVLLDAGDIDGAQRSFENALQRMPSSEAYFNLGVTEYYSRRYATAIPFFESALRMRPDSDIYVLALGDSLRHLHRVEAARTCYTRALALLESRERSRALDLVEKSRRAIAFARLGDSKAARIILDAVESDSVTQEVAYARAVVSALEGRPSQSNRELAEAVRKGYPSALVEMDPDFDDVH